MLRALLLIADGFEDRDVIGVAQALQGRGVEVTYGGKKAGERCTGAGGTTLTAGVGYLNANLFRYALVVVPGGAAGPAIAAHKSLVNIVYTVAHKGRAVATVGTGIQALLAAAIQKPPYDIANGVHNIDQDLAKGRVFAAPGDLRAEIEKSGAQWTEQAVMVDGSLVTARDTQGTHLQRFVDAAVATAEQYQRLVHESWA